MLVKSIYDSKGCRGIQRIEIPKTNADFLPSNDYGVMEIKKYFPQIISQHKINAQKEKFFYDYYLGVQDIYDKTRPYQKDQINNNIICENHALSQVDGKVSIITSEPREYTAKQGIANDETIKDDLTYLDRYKTDVDFDGKDKTVKDWIYICGVGCTDVRPNINAIGLRLTPSGETEYYFMDKTEGFDIEYQSPFEFNSVSPIENFVVYSSGRNKEPLFSVSIVEVEKEPDNKNSTATMFLYQIETRYAVFTLNTNRSFKNASEPILLTTKDKNHNIPIVEHSANNSRIGIIEINKTLYDSINTLISSATDMVVDNANVIMVFKNVDIDGNTVKDMKKAGAIVLKSNASTPNASADFDTIQISIDFDGLDRFYQQRLMRSYDIVGVPMASGNTTSGGDTGQAKLLSNGWESARKKAESETNTMKISDRIVLDQMLSICREYPNCPLNKITASQIDIKYKLNSSDNFLVKAQGMKNCYDMNMPKEMILKMSGAISDINAGANAWEENDERLKAQSIEQKSVDENNIDDTQNVVE